ncbi:MAG: hypothetical protein FWG74_02065 [Planctomycetes bacterium]|nr:hypothetical protein [Planctomycetota bacterium]
MVVHGGDDALDLRIVEIQAVLAVSHGEGIERGFLKIVQIALAAVGRPGVEGELHVSLKRPDAGRSDNACYHEFVGFPFGTDVETSVAEAPVVIH